MTRNEARRLAASIRNGRHVSWKKEDVAYLIERLANDRKPDITALSAEALGVRQCTCKPLFGMPPKNHALDCEGNLR